MTDKFDAIKYGWTLEKAEKQMTLIPSCHNCKFLTYLREIKSDGTTFDWTLCRKHEIGNPCDVCKDWFPEAHVIRCLAYARMAYQQLSRKKKKDE